MPNVQSTAGNVESRPTYQQDTPHAIRAKHIIVAVLLLLWWLLAGDRILLLCAGLRIPT